MHCAALLALLHSAEQRCSALPCDRHNDTIFGARTGDKQRHKYIHAKVTYGPLYTSGDDDDRMTARCACLRMCTARLQQIIQDLKERNVVLVEQNASLQTELVMIQSDPSLDHTPPPFIDAVLLWTYILSKVPDA